jgi:IS30 family transposase
MDRISDTERQRIAELLAEGAPVWRLHKEINRSRYAIRRAVVALHRPPKRDLDAVAAELNDRPRQTLGWKSPCQALDEVLR